MILILPMLPVPWMALNLEQMENRRWRTLIEPLLQQGSEEEVLPPVVQPRLQMFNTVDRHLHHRGLHHQLGKSLLTHPAIRMLFRPVEAVRPNPEMMRGEAEGPTGNLGIAEPSGIRATTLKDPTTGPTSTSEE